MDGRSNHAVELQFATTGRGAAITKSPIAPFMVIHVPSTSGVLRRWQGGEQRWGR